MDVGVIDCGLGNIGSVRKMCDMAGGNTYIVRTPKDLETAERIILPGVGAFDEGMNRLEESGLKDGILCFAKEKNKQASAAKKTTKAKVKPQNPAKTVEEKPDETNKE